MKLHSIRQCRAAALSFVIAAAATAAADGAAPVAAILPHLGAVDKSVYFEVADTTGIGEGFDDAQVIFERLADALEAAGKVDADVIAMVRRAPAALRELGLFSVAGFGRSVADEGNGVLLHRSFWAGGDARVWDLVATDAPAPVDCLPADSVLAVASSADPRALWDVARAVCGTLAPDALAAFDDGVRSVRADMGIDVTNLVASLRPGVFAAITLDSSKTFAVDGCDAPLPSPGIVLGVRCETRDFLVSLATLAGMGLGDSFQFEQLGPNGEAGFVVKLPDEATEGLPFELLPTVRWSPAKKMLVFASTQALACNALEDVAAPKLADSPAFKELAAGLPAEGTLRWISPELVRTLNRIADGTDDTPDMVKDLLAGAGDVWYVGCSRRFPDGLESVSRSTFSSPAVSRCVLELYQGSGLFVAGALAGMVVPAVQSTTSSAKATKTGIAGRDIVQAIIQANIDREAASKSPVWPTKGKWNSSSDYFERLLGRQLLDGIAAADVAPFYGGVAWCCLAGIAGENDVMPFLWSPNLELNEEDFARPVDPANPADWSGKVSDEEPVILVRKGGAMQIIKRGLLSDVTFFCGETPLHPENLEVLLPEPGF